MWGVFWHHDCSFVSVGKKSKDGRRPTGPLPGYRGPDGGKIPRSLKGARKWSTVKLQDGKTPSKDEVFLGSLVSLPIGKLPCSAECGKLHNAGCV